MAALVTGSSWMKGGSPPVHDSVLGLRAQRNPQKVDSENANSQPRALWTQLNPLQHGFFVAHFDHYLLHDHKFIIHAILQWPGTRSEKHLPNMKRMAPSPCWNLRRSKRLKWHLIGKLAKLWQGSASLSTGRQVSSVWVRRKLGSMYVLTQIA